MESLENELTRGETVIVCVTAFCEAFQSQVTTKTNLKKNTQAFTMNLHYDS